MIKLWKGNGNQWWLEWINFSCPAQFAYFDLHFYLSAVKSKFQRCISFLLFYFILANTFCLFNLLIPRYGSLVENQARCQTCTVDGTHRRQSLRKTSSTFWCLFRLIIYSFQKKKESLGLARAIKKDRRTFSTLCNLLFKWVTRSNLFWDK